MEKQPASTKLNLDHDHQKLDLAQAGETLSDSGRPSQKTKFPRWSEKRKEKGIIALACSWTVDHQIGIAAYLLSFLYLIHFSFPIARHHTEKFHHISYYNPQSGTYALGWDDIFFVFYWIIVFTGVRCLAIDYILTPVAAWAGIQKKKPRLRFAEQAWILLYYTCSWSTGIYIMYRSDYWMNLRALWRNWPVREMDGLAKWYYLVQFAFWLQQIVVVNIEERRKDHWQMFSHHLITCALIFTSYGYHQTKAGTVILCIMDIVDLFFPLAKILKYLHLQLACDIAFGVFMFTWFVTRHVLYMIVCWSVYVHIPQEIEFGCYEGSNQDLRGPFPIPNDFDHLTQPFRNPEGLVCWNSNITFVFLGLLLALQAILCVWFGMICRVAYKVVTGQGAEDSRSDDEDEEEEELEKDFSQRTTDIEKSSPSFPPHKPSSGSGGTYFEKEVLSTDPNFRFATTSTNVNTRSKSSKPLKSPQPPSLSSASLNTNNIHKASPTDYIRQSSRSPRPSKSVLGESSSGGHSSSVNLRDRKDLLGRIGCEVRIN